MTDPWIQALAEGGHGRRRARRAAPPSETWSCIECGQAGDADTWGDPPDVCPACNCSRSCVLDADGAGSLTIEQIEDDHG